MFYKIKNEYFIFFISFLIYLPPILWGNYFMDDSYRSLDGRYDWVGDYRPVADLIYYILGQGYFIDLFPYTYIIQIFICSYFIYIITKKTQQVYDFNAKYEKFVSLGFFCLFLNPFFLQNIYFRYDSLPMMLSIIFVCLPLYFEYRKIIISMVFCLLTLLTYQSSIIGFPILICLHTLFLLSKNHTQKEVVLFISNNILALFLAFIFFGFISKFLIEPNYYASENLNFIFSYSNWKNLLYENIKYSIGNLIITNRLLDYIIFSILLILSILSILLILKNHKSNFVFKVAIFLGLMLMCSLALLNINIFLYQPRLHARTYIGFGFMNLFIYLSVVFYFLKKPIKKNEFLFLFFILSYLPFIYFGINSATFNAMKDLTKYNENVIFSLIQDIKRIKTNQDHLIALGDAGYTKRYNSILENYPIVERIDNQSLNMNIVNHFYGYMGNYNLGLNTYFYRDVLFNNIKIYNSIKNEKPKIKTGFYNIYLKDSNIIIIFKEDNLVNIKKMRSRFDY